MRRAAGTVGRVLALRDDTFKPHLACMGEEGRRMSRCWARRVSENISSRARYAAGGGGGGFGGLGGGGFGGLGCSMATRKVK